MLNLCYCYNTVPNVPNSESLTITTPDEIRSAFRKIRTMKWPEGGYTLVIKPPRNTPLMAFGRVEFTDELERHCREYRRKPNFNIRLVYRMNFDSVAAPEAPITTTGDYPTYIHEEDDIEVSFPVFSVFDREKEVKCFLYSDLGRVAYVHTGYGVYSLEELKIVPTKAYQRECPEILPGQGGKFLGLKEKTAMRLAWEVSGATNFRWTENGVECDWNSNFFISYGVVFPFPQQPRGLSYLAKTHSLVNAEKKIVGWYIFVDSEEDAEKIVKDEDVR